MDQDGLKKRLSGMDAFFLYIETEEAPMSVGCVALFERRMSFRKFVQNLDKRLDMVPRYRQKIQYLPLNLGHPSWEYDPHFDISRHVFEKRVPAPGSDKELRALAAQLFEKPLSRDKPLWEMYLIQGLAHGRTALMTKVHHCMVDGVAGIDLLFALFDTAPEPPKRRTAPYVPPPRPPLAERISEAVWDVAIDRVEYWTQVQHELARLGQGEQPAQVAKSLRAFAGAMGGFLSPIHRLPINKPFSGKRKLAWGTCSFAEARAIRNACGGTFNDVMLTVLTGAIMRYTEHAGEPVKGRDFRILVPVNLRREEERGTMGNRITFLPLALPLDIRDPVERLHVTHTMMQSMRHQRVPEAMHMMFTLLQGAYVPLQASLLQSATTAAGRSVLDMLYHVPPLHMICTNVPGPQIPLYTIGHRLLGFYPLVPATLDMGVTLGITTYNQEVFFTFIADAGAVPDVDRLAELFIEEFTRLRIRAEVEERIRVEIAKLHENPPADLSPEKPKRGTKAKKAAGTP